MRNPVLFIIFNRPHTTQVVFDEIRAARPPRLYIAADGPREGRPEEIQKCENAKEIALSVDWPCEVKTLFRTKNLGCKLAVSSAIDWFFENEPEGIILEDDVRPIPSFFAYCDELLERYRESQNVAMISGCNLITKDLALKESYLFSIHTHIWGWASWRRAWKLYDINMDSWQEWSTKGGLESIGNDSILFSSYWRNIFNRCYAGEIDTWDYQWTFACWKNNMLAILPKYNQTFNLGFGVDATHTITNAPSYVLKSTPKSLEFPLIHPEDISSKPTVDALINHDIYDITFLKTIKNIFVSNPYTFILKKIKKWLS